MPRATAPFRSGLAAGAAVVLIAGCSTSPGSPSASAAVAGPVGARPVSAAPSFCGGAEELVTRYETAGTSVDPDFRKEVFQEVAAGSRIIEPPADIAPDWAALTEELDRQAQAWRDLDFRDPSHASAAADLQDRISASFLQIKTYLLDRCGVGSSLPGGTTVFSGDFETGDFSQWSRCQTREYSGPCRDMPPDFYGMQIVDSGARQGRYAARFELREGDNPSWGGGERTEVARYKNGTVREGEERWYAFSLMFDPAFPAENDEYLMVMQWHGANHLPPPMGIEVQGDGQLVLSSHYPPGPSMVIGDIARGEWVDYLVRAHFSMDAEKGWAEVYRDGALVIPRHSRATMNSDYDYVKMGLYRDGHGSKPTAVMLADRFTITSPVTPSRQPG